MPGTQWVLTDGTTSCDLTAGTAYIAKRGSIKVRREGTGETAQIIVDMTLGVIGATLSEAMTNLRALVSVKRTADTWRNNNWGRLVTLTLTYAGGTANILDVVEVQLPELARRWASESVFDDFPVSFVCRPYFRGTEAQVVAATTIQNHYDSTHTNMVTVPAAGLAGDGPAEARIWLENNDPTAEYGTVRIGCFADVRSTGVTPEPVVEAGEPDVVGYGTISVIPDATCSGGQRLNIQGGGNKSLYCNNTRSASVADASWQDLGTEFTLECAIWLDAGIADDPAPLIAKWNSTGNQKSYALLVEDKKLRFVMSSDGTNVDVDARGNSVLQTEMWHWVHIEYLYEDLIQRRYVTIYLNGIEDGFAVNTIPSVDTTINPDANGTDRAWSRSTGSDDYTLVRDDDDATYIYSSTNAARTGVHVGDVTVAAGDTVSQIAVRVKAWRTEYALNCDNTNYASIADAAWQDLGTAFTLEGWVKLNADIGTAPQPLIAKWNSTGNQKSYALLVEGDAGGNRILRFLVSTDGSTKNIDVQGTTALSLSTWHWVHAEFYYDPTTLIRHGYIYLDGVLDGSASNSVEGTTTLDPITGAQTDAEWSDDTYGNVSDNNDATYMYTSTNGAKSSFPAGNITLTGTVAWVKVRAKVSDLNAQPAVKLYVVVNGTRYYSATMYVSEYWNYPWVEATWATDPSTNAAWTQDAINGLEIGVFASDVGHWHGVGGEVIYGTLVCTELEAVVYEYAAAATAPHAGTATLAIGTCDGWDTGDNITGSTAAGVFHGVVDEVRIYNAQATSTRTAPAAELTGGTALYHCNDGAGTTLADSSGNGYDMTLSGAAWAAGYSWPSDVQSSIRAFLYLSSAYHTGASQTITQTATWYTWLWLQNPAAYATWTEAALDAVECGIEVVASGGRTIRVSEIEMVVSTCAVAEKTPYAGTADLVVGDCGGWATADSIDTSSSKAIFDGRIDEVRISNRWATESRVTPSIELTGGLLLVHFNEGQGTAAADSSGHGRDLTLTGEGWTDGFFASVAVENYRGTFTASRRLFDQFSGWYDVFARLRVTADSVDDIAVRCAWENGPWWTQDKQKVALLNTWVTLWLGRVHLPWHAVQDDWISDDVFSETARRRFELWTTHVADTDALDINSFTFVPVRPFSGKVWDMEMAAGEGIIVSTVDEKPWVGRTGTTRLLTQAPKSMGVQMIAPYMEAQNYHYVIVLLDRTDGSNNIDDTIDVTVRYMPRYEWTWI